MKKNLDLIRKILISIESHDEPFPSSTITIDGFNSAEITYHIGLLHEAQMIRARSLHQVDGDTLFHISGMTFQGHEYLDAVRSPKVWQCVKDKAVQSSINLTLDIAKEIAISFIRQQLGA